MSNRKRRVVWIESMFKDICLPEEMKKVDELYANGFKASAIVFMTRRIRDHWEKLINGKEPKNTETTFSPRPSVQVNNKPMLHPIQW